MNNEKAKQEIKNLVEKYQRVVEIGQIRSYNEEMTKKDFILPLFRALGWNIEDSQEVSAEVHTFSSGRVDYAFIINGFPKFYLEAKALKEDLSREDFAKQAIRYAWNRGIDWAVLTNFESIKVFNAQAPSKYLGDKLVFEIKMGDYLTDERLELLTRESFIKNLLVEYAIKIGKMVQKISVGEQLFKDLNESREILTKVLHEQNPKLDKDLLDEGVQKILDRLIFIRVVEDRGLEPERSLLAMIHEYQSNKKMGKVTLFQTMVERFRELDKIYDSSLFEPHPCENWEEFSGTAEKIIQRFYGKPGYYEFDFKEISADVLGTVYENYLGYIAKNPIKAVINIKSGKLFEVEGNEETKTKSRKKRKEQGIYYTPGFIVDYIVKNTLGKILSEIKSPAEVKNLKILDPACGSGSFLTKAYQSLIEFYEKQGVKINSKTKLGEIAKTIQEKGATQELSTPERLRILRENIFGVDLDKQAVEIARLNLLLNAVTKRTKLPNLVNNIKWGNSLISGTEAELKKYFGENWRDKKPFNWDEEFPFCHSRASGNPGFDVIIGNPPWVSLKGKQKSLDFDEKELQYFFNKLNASTYRPNLFEMFIWRSLGLLKRGGLFSFIVPDRLCVNEQFVNLRKYILENFSIKKLWFKVKFPGIIGDTVVFVIQNKKSDKNFIEVTEFPNIDFQKIPQEYFLNSDGYALQYIPERISLIFDKIFRRSKKLSKIIGSAVGFIAKSNEITSNSEDNIKIKVLKGENIVRYGLKGNYYFDFKKENLAGGTQDIEKLGSKNKILLRKTGADIIASFDDSGMFPEQSLYFLYGSDRDVMLPILTILNSRLLNVYYYYFAITNREATPQLKKVDLDKFPMMPLSNKQKIELSGLAKKMIELNKELRETPENSDKWQAIKSEIEKTDKLIDQKVYELYRLTEEEIKIIEENFKIC